MKEDEGEGDGADNTPQKAKGKNVHIFWPHYLTRIYGVSVQTPMSILGEKKMSMNRKFDKCALQKM